MDRLKKAPPNKDAIIYEYDDIKLKNIYLRIKGRDELDNNYANALKKEKKLVLQDSLNALYVAFTRAQENLFVVKKSKDSIFDILELSVAKYGTLNVKTAKKPNSQKTSDTLNYEDEYYGAQSDVVKELDDEIEADIKAQNFGTALHFMLEMLSSFSNVAIVDAQDMMLNKYGHILESDEVEDIKQRIEMLVADAEFKKLSFGECFKEQSLRFEDKLLYIDLLVKHEDGVYKIIDYKSSLNHSDKHQEQVRNYIDAVESITGATARGYLCYLLNDKVSIIEV
jgi:exodeoxyribonuclease V beta subunit